MTPRNVPAHPQSSHADSRSTDVLQFSHQGFRSITVKTFILVLATDNSEWPEYLRGGVKEECPENTKRVE